MKPSPRIASLLLLLLGVDLYTLVGWKWNVAAAAWLAPIFLVRYFRTRTRWTAALAAVLLLWGASYLNKAGVWGMDWFFEVAVLGLAALPLILALFLDQFTARRLPAFWASLVFPAAFILLDYAVSFLPLGTVFSLAITQVYAEPLVQVAKFTGIWGIEFVVLWAAPIFNLLWEHGFDPRPVRAPLGVYAAVLAAVLLYGGLRLVVERPAAQTVRVAGITAAHPRNYWDVLIDQGTPEDQAQAYQPEFQALEEQLFAQSEQAAQGGAQVIFWSEADAFLLPGQKEAFLQRAAAFARRRQVYLVPAYQVLRYGDTSGFNGLAMITPQGELAFEYEKTMSWYATTSDGILHSIQTPYGRIGALICFDMDFPSLVRQASAQQVDVMVVPAFDTYAARVYHTEVSLFRAVDTGFSMMRMANEGVSMAVDHRGHLLASQDFFTTPSRILYADLPVKGVATLYGLLGDWFAWLCGAVAAGSLLAAVLRPAQKMEAAKQGA